MSKFDTVDDFYNQSCKQYSTYETMVIKGFCRLMDDHFDPLPIKTLLIMLGKNMIIWLHLKLMRWIPIMRVKAYVVMALLLTLALVGVLNIDLII